MKETELMIGDYLYWGKDKVVKVQMLRKYGDNFGVDAIYNDSVNLYFCTNNDDIYSYNIDELKPIPLTPEILEKNGWVYNNEDEKFFPQTWVGGGLMLQSAGDCGYCIVVTSDYDDEDTNGTPFIILYVHELQHALRLSGIKKEIEI